MISCRIQIKTMDKIFLFVIFLVSFSFIFLIPSVQAGITFQPRTWTESCSHELNETVIECQDKSFLTKYINFTFTENAPDNWDLCLEMHPVLWNHLKECYLKSTDSEKLQCLKQIYQDYKDKVDVDLNESQWLNYLQELRQYPIKKLTSHVTIDKDSINFTNKKVCLNIDFPQGWKVNEKIKTGFASITYASSTNLITVVGDATCGDSEENACDFDDLWVADKGGTIELMENQTGASQMNLSLQLRPTDNVTIPMIFNVTNIHLNNLNNCNISGLLGNGSTVIETINFTDNTTYATVNYFKSIENSTINCSDTFDVQIYQNQWGLIWKPGTSQFTFDGKIQIGDGSTTTWFADTNKQIIVSDDAITADGQWFIEVKINGYLKFGSVVNAAKKISEDGCQFTGLETSNWYYLCGPRNTEIYSSSFTSFGYDRMIIYGQTIWNSIFNGQGISSVRPYGTTSDWFNFIVTRCVYGMLLATTGTFNKLQCMGTTTCVYTYGSGNFSVSNIYARDATNILRCGAASNTSNVYLVNVDSDIWSILWSNCNATVYRQYEFDLNVTDTSGRAISGANVSIESLSGDPLCSNHTNVTYANGSIPTQTIMMGYYNQTGGDTIYTCNPYRIKINKTGYGEYETNFTLDRKTDWTIALGNPCSPDPDYLYALNYGMSYNATSNTITLVNTTSIGTSSNPYNFTSVWEYARAINGSCLVERMNETQFLFNVKLQVGDGGNETWFADSDKQVTFLKGIATAHEERLIWVRYNANFRLGILEDATTFSTRSGCTITSLETTYRAFLIRDDSSAAPSSKISIYSSSLGSIAGTGLKCYLGWSSGNWTIWNTLLSGTYPVFSSTANVNIYNLYVANAYTGFGDTPASGTLNYINIKNCDYGIATSSGFTIKNSILKNITTTDFRLTSVSNDCYAINTESSWTFTWLGTSTKKLYRQYEFDLNVTDTSGRAIEGVNVSIQSLSSDPVCSDYRNNTYANGSISTQTITMGYYNQTGGDTIYSCNPYRIKINKTGYGEYETNFNIDRKTDWTIALGNPCSPDPKYSYALDYGMSYDESTNTITLVNTTSIGTSSNPYNFTSVWEYARAINGSCLVDRMNETQFFFKTKLQIGDGNNQTWFADKEKQIVFSDIMTANGDKYINVKNNANFTLGECTDTTLKVVQSGCSIFSTQSAYINTRLVYGDSNSIVYLYDSSLQQDSPRAQASSVTLEGTGRVWGCRFSRQVRISGSSTNVDHYNLHFGGAYSTQGDVRDAILSAEGTWDKIVIEDYYNAIQGYGGYPLNIKNLIIRKTANYELTFYRQYEFDLNVTDTGINAIGGANVTIESLSGDPLCSNHTNVTYTNGSIPTQTITMGYYNETGGDAIYSCNPYRITINSSGYGDYQTNFTIDRKTDWTIALGNPCTPDPKYSYALNYGMSYDESSNTITLVNTTTIGTGSNPYNFTSVWEYARAINGSCLVDRMNETQFLFNLKLIIGDGNNQTYFNDGSKQITFNGVTTVDWQAIIIVQNNAQLTLGVLDDASTKSTSNGVSIIVVPNGRQGTIIFGYIQSSKIYIYDSLIVQTDPFYAWYGIAAFYTGNIYHTTFDGCYLINNILNMSDVRIGFSNQKWPAFQNQGGTLENLIAYGATRFISFTGTTSITLINPVGKWLKTSAFGCWDQTVNHYLINPDFDNWGTSWSGTNTNKVYRQYEFDLNVTDTSGRAIEGVNVSIQSLSSDPICSDYTNNTYANGSISTQTVTMGYYNETGGDSIYSCNPYRITINSSGYGDYQTNFTIDRKTDWTIALGNPCSPDDTYSDYLNRNMTYNATSNTITLVGDSFLGANESNPYTFEDVWKYARAINGSCLVDRLNETQYLFKTKLQIGDDNTTTWFADSNVQVTFTDIATANGDWHIRLARYGNLRFGILENATSHTTSRGVSFFLKEDTYIVCRVMTTTALAQSSELYSMNIYSSYFAASKLNSQQLFERFNGNMWNTELGYEVYIHNPLSTADFYNVNIFSTYRGIGLPYGTWNKIIVGKCQLGVDMTTTYPNYTLKNVIIQPDCVYDFYMRNNGIAPRFHKVINGESDWIIYWYPTPPCVDTLLRQYKFDLNVTDTSGNAISGANISIESLSGYSLCTNHTNVTYTDGSISTQTITIGYYNETGGDTIYDCNPYIFKVEKPGYEILNFTANITEKTDWTLSLEEGKTQLTLIKNIQYSDENSTHVNYTITDQVINTGTINVSGIVFQDSDISASFVINNLEVNETNTTSGTVTVAKAMNNQEKTFVSATATVDTTVYSSNQPSVLIPGTGGPADVSVSVPSSVSVGGTIVGNITITNMNPDIGQDFTVDYFITSLDEATNYSSGQKTIYVGASSTNSTLGSLSVPGQAGTYDYKAVVSWIGDSASASATFTATEAAPTIAPTGPTGGAMRLGKGEIKISEYPEITIEQGSVEFYSITVENNGTASVHNVELTLEGISREWYSLIPERVDDLLKGKSQVFILKITTPLDAEPKFYPVDIKASCDEGLDLISISFEVVPRAVEEPFRIVDIQVLTQKLLLNEKGTLMILVENVGDEDLNVVASLTLPEGWFIDEKEVTKVIPQKTESILRFNITPIETGAHRLVLNGNYNGKEFSKEISVYVEEIITIPSISWQWFIVLIVLAGLTTICGIIIQKKLHKLKPEKLKEITPETKKEEPHTCARCGKRIGVYDAGLHYKGKVYCIKCLVDAEIVK